METPLKHFLMFALLFALTACATPVGGIVPLGGNLPKPLPVTPTTSYTQCAFVWASQAQPELSARLVKELKHAALPVETARAEAYGENCVAADDTVVSFAQMETDFYITLNAPDLADQAALGNLLEKALTVIDQFLPSELGPEAAGYIGITFQTGSQTQNLWFTYGYANNLRKQGLKGADLYQALANKP